MIFLSSVKLNKRSLIPVKLDESIKAIKQKRRLRDENLTNVKISIERTRKARNVRATRRKQRDVETLGFRAL